MKYRFTGALFLLGRTPGLLLGHRIRTSLDDLPDGIDGAVILTPAREVPALLAGRGRLGRRHAVVASSGGEPGAGGAWRAPAGRGRRGPAPASFRG